MAVTPSLYTLVHVYDIPAAPQDKRVGEWQLWVKTCWQRRWVTAPHPTATPVCASHAPADIF